MLEVTVQCAGLELSAQSSKALSDFDAEQPVVLFLHGWLDNSESLVPLAKQCDAEQLLVLDLPGHGKSQHRNEGAYYYFSEWALDIAAIIEHYKWHNVILVGHSMGGFIAQLAALAQPEKISALFLIEAFGLLTYKEEETTDKLRQAWESRLALKHKEAPAYASFDRVLKARAERGDIAAETIEPVVLRNMMETSKGWQWRIDPRVRLGSPFRYSLSQVDNLMSNLKCRLVLIRGSKGFQDIDQAVNRWGQNLHIKVIEGGHHVHLEQPAKVAMHLNAFILHKN
ncbi:MULTISPECIES: alpha/beta fold hydrolase [Gammaproteobacteria]|uniref:alpha/beta fold hydrolase n=1 Tax=Gammaproteobacteria TaxID=1236 RepID=UPI000DD07BFB|nr:MULTISPECIES: alpha/beta hydrolase [Gammaproteobacteria]RTE87607.1 alpha/beta hydrolase [Aliidiomarina sp. B3213]TCZ92608.1 alpha/beta hydrolase [Lysobacter sp. N42]